MVNIAEIKRQMFKERLEKAFSSEEIEKARHGVYADTAENRAKQRVGQEYGQAAQPQEPGEKRQPKGGEEGGGDIKSYASNASDEALKRAAADKNAKPEVREAAKNELANRNGGNDKKSEPAKKEEKKDADSVQPKDSEKKNAKPSQKEIDERQRKIDELTYDINWYRNPRHRTELKGEEKDKVEAWEKELAELENDDRFIDKSAKIRGEYINHDFADSLTKKDLKKILKETGNGKDVYTVSSARYDKDKKALVISGRGSGSSWIEKIIPLNTISSSTLTEKYKEYGDKVDEIVNKKNPGELDKHDLADAINTEVNTIFSDTSNDDPTFRDKVYDIYKKYSKDNPMDAWKYSQYVGHMDAGQAVQLGYYINARNAGATPPEAEKYMKDTYEDHINYTKEHNFDSSGFAPKAFKKGI